MALGNTKISEIEGQIPTLQSALTKMENEYGTFLYVVDNLRNWADDTTIGEETIQSLKDLLKRVTDTNASAKNCCTAIENLCEEQKRINTQF